jgi:opacity protein-like surface antigen
MKKLLTASLLAASLATASHAGSYLDYLGFGLALQDVNSPNFDNGTALVINGGTALYQGFGVEFEGTASIQKMEGSYAGITDEMDFWSLGMYSTYIWKLGNLSITPRLGLIYDSLKSDVGFDRPQTQAATTTQTTTQTATGETTTQTTVQQEATTLSQGIDKNGLGLSIGIGLSYELGENYNIYTNYTRMEDDISHLTFGAQFKF